MTLVMYTICKHKHNLLIYTNSCTQATPAQTRSVRVMATYMASILVLWYIKVERG